MTRNIDTPERMQEPEKPKVNSAKDIETVYYSLSPLEKASEGNYSKREDMLVKMMEKVITQDASDPEQHIVKRDSFNVTTFSRNREVENQEAIRNAKLAAQERGIPFEGDMVPRKPNYYLCEVQDKHRPLDFIGIDWGIEKRGAGGALKKTGEAVIIIDLNDALIGEDGLPVKVNEQGDPTDESNAKTRMGSHYVVATVKIESGRPVMAKLGPPLKMYTAQELEDAYQGRDNDKIGVAERKLLNAEIDGERYARKSGRIFRFLSEHPNFATNWAATRTKEGAEGYVYEKEIRGSTTFAAGVEMKTDVMRRIGEDVEQKYDLFYQEVDKYNKWKTERVAQLAPELALLLRTLEADLTPEEIAEVIRSKQWEKIVTPQDVIRFYDGQQRAAVGMSSRERLAMNQRVIGAQEGMKRAVVERAHYQEERNEEARKAREIEERRRALEEQNRALLAQIGDLEQAQLELQNRLSAMRQETNEALKASRDYVAYRDMAAEEAEKALREEKEKVKGLQTRSAAQTRVTAAIRKGSRRVDEGLTSLAESVENSGTDIAEAITARAIKSRRKGKGNPSNVSVEEEA